MVVMSSEDLQFLKMLDYCRELCNEQIKVKSDIVENIKKKKPWNGDTYEKAVHEWSVAIGYFDMVHKYIKEFVDLRRNEKEEIK